MDPEEIPNDISEIITLLDNKVLQARTSGDPVERRELVIDCFMIACRLLSKITTKLTPFVQKHFRLQEREVLSVQTLEATGTEDVQAKLKVFRDQDEFEIFLNSLSGLLKTVNYPPDHVAKVIGECRTEFEAIRKVQITPNLYENGVEKFEKIFCSPPPEFSGDDLDGGPRPRRPAGGGDDGGKSLWEKIASGINALASVATILTTFFPSPKLDPPPTLPKSPPSIEIMALAVLLIITLGEWTDSSGLTSLLEVKRTISPTQGPVPV